MELYHSARSSASYRVRIALAVKGLAYESRLLDMQAMQHRSARYREINPLGLVPALVTPSGVLTQSLAIIEYLDECHPEPPLLPRDPEERAYVRGLAQLIACEIHPLNNLRTLERVRAMAGEEGVDRWYRHWIADGFGMVEAFLARHRRHGRHALGDRVTLADCCLVPQVANARRRGCALDAYPTIVAIDEACRALPAFRAASPEAQTGPFWQGGGS